VSAADGRGARDGVQARDAAGAHLGAADGLGQRADATGGRARGRSAWPRRHGPLTAAPVRAYPRSLSTL
jgi:hypothetical protein